MNRVPTRLSACLLLLAAPLATPAFAQDPAAATLYKKKCAVCHESGADGVPERKTLEQKAPADIVKALTTGPMKAVGSVLTADQKKSIADYLSVKGESASKKSDKSNN